MKNIQFVHYVILYFIGYAKCVELQDEILMFINGETTTKDLGNRFKEYYSALTTTEQDQWSCDICRTVVEKGIAMQRLKNNRKEIRKFASSMCDFFLSSAAVECNRYVDHLIDTWMYIVDNKPKLTAESVCRIRLQENNCFVDTEKTWQVNMPEESSKELLEVNDGVKYKVLHLTDIHYDPLYKVGSNAVCKDVLCCESISGEPNVSTEAAGYWGDSRVCDMPWYAVENLLEQVAEQNFDWVYFTGDLISHQIGATSPSRNINTIQKVMAKLKGTFKNVPIYPILGNHEPHPADAFAPESITRKAFSSQWLFETVAEEWGPWLNSDAQTTLRKGGYYTTLIKPTLRLIALNSNVCFTNNIWLFYEEQDPYNQLQWLADTLLKAESNNEAVHILSHIPSGEKTCLKQWNSIYGRIIQRFHRIITAQFNGHTHADGLKVYYKSEKNNDVISVAFNGGSFTTFVGNNPNYKTYDIHGSHGRVLDYQVWTYNLADANASREKPKWFQLYSFLEAFDIDKLNEANLNGLIRKLGSNKKMLETYRRFQSRNGTSAMKDCNVQCLKEVFCDITQTEFEESYQCKWFKIK